MQININRSFIYVYPMVVDIVNYQANLMNVYVRDLNKPEYDNHIFLRYRFNGDLKNSYLKFEKEIQECKYLETMYDLPEGKGESVMFVFKVPEEHQSNYDAFMNSKYSQMDSTYKDKVIEYHAKRNEANRNVLLGILYKTEERKKKMETDLGVTFMPHEELLSSWSEENEFFPISTYSIDDLLNEFENKEHETE